MAPEQVVGEAHLIDQRTDIYALGVVLYELLVGKLPYHARTPLALREQILFRQPAPFDENVPKSIQAICNKCLSKHPVDRYATAEELGLALRAALNPPKKRWHWAVLWIALFIAAAIGAWK